MPNLVAMRLFAAPSPAISKALAWVTTHTAPLHCEPTSSGRSDPRGSTAVGRPDYSYPQAYYAEHKPSIYLVYSCLESHNPL